MAFYQRALYLPQVRTYEQAVRHEASITPIRGRTPELKPLGRRRDTMYSIRKGSGETIVIKMHYTDILTYYPDGRIAIYLGGWATPTTKQAISAILGTHAPHLFQNSMWMEGYNSPDEDATYGKYCIPTDTPAIVTWHPTHPRRLVIHNYEQHYRHVINRKGMREVRARYAPFADYLESFIKLRGERIEYLSCASQIGVSTTRDEVVAAFGNLESIPLGVRNYDQISALMLDDGPNAHESYYRACLALCMVHLNFIPSNTVTASDATMRNSMAGIILRINAAICLTRKPMPLGKQVKDNYSWAVGHVA